MKKNTHVKEMQLNEVDEKTSPYVDDYSKQLVILQEAYDRVMNECGLIYPAVAYLQDALEDITIALTNAIIEATNIKSVKDVFIKARKCEEWNRLNRDFREWREMLKRHSNK